MLNQGRSLGFPDSLFKLSRKEGQEYGLPGLVMVIPEGVDIHLAS